MTTQEQAYSEIERLVHFPARVDEEIDKRVYVRYGLTKEEIKIVEGR